MKTPREIGVALMRQGLATAAEVGRLAGITRQGARHWATSEEPPIDVEAARNRLLKELWKRKAGE